MSPNLLGHTIFISAKRSNIDNLITIHILFVCLFVMLYPCPPNNICDTFSYALAADGLFFVSFPDIQDSSTNKTDCQNKMFILHYTPITLTLL